ncbi:unnamed protein product [Lymnaea stagnalis]|uniref:UDENN FNIP1/2-type domain-containing protein n=1 Tax=Lymnaea stagnalis TaxID=6523 RepID=A0AAV2H750_LYMST
MALFQRIFSSKKTQRNFTNDKNVRKNDQIQKTVPPKLDKSKIRLVIYADSDRGRTPFFDSDAIKPLEDTDKNVIKAAPKAMRAKGLNYSSQKESSIPQQRQAPKYHFSRLGSDVKVLEEMMFGTVGMAFKASTLKVHLLRCPTKLMVSKVFIPEKPCRDSFGDTESDSNSLPDSSADFSSDEFNGSIHKPKEKYVKSIPVDVPNKELLSDYSTDDDSGLASFTSSGSLRASFPSPSNNSISSYNSLHRRWMRAQTTSLDGHHRKQLHESNLIAESSISRRSRSKLAIGILIGSQDDKDEESNNLFQSFFFSHFALIESHVEKLRSVTEKAYFNTRNFLPTIMEALENFRNSIYDLYMAPRLPEPVWLTMMSTTTYKTKLCEKFMKTFVNLIAKYDNKNCKFFVSTLLSAVLTQHLAWVATVTPAGGTPSPTYLDKHTAKWVDTLAKTHPYNPLWAQLGDLFGAIGLPLKISRTMVVGKKAEVVKDFLYILSYFIRCSEVHENSDPQCLSKIVNDPLFDASLSPTLSEKTLYVEGSCPDGNISPCACGNVFTRQTSTGPIKSGDSVRNLSWFKDSAVLRRTISEHNGALTHTDNQSCTRLERSDSGYNGTQFENSSEQMDEILDYESEVDSLTASSLNLAVKSTSSPCDNSFSCSECPFPKCPRSEYDDKSLSACNQDKVNSPSECLGISELHMYSLNSLCSLTSAKPLESPRLEKVLNVVKAPPALKVDFPDQLGPEPLSRSESFSDAKVRSRLAQQLESAVAQNEAAKVKAAEIRKFISEGTGSEEYFYDGTGKKNETAESDKIMVASSGSGSSWLLGDIKKETEQNAKNVISRQVSQDQKPPSGRPTSLARVRSLTPTSELSRRRHLSSTGSIDYEAFDPMIHCKEVQLPCAVTDSGQWHIKAFDRNFGRSLLAGYTDHYMSDFVLHGTSDTNYKSHLLNDLQMTVKHSILDEPIDEAVCVIADTDNWTVEVASSKVMSISPSGCTAWTSSQLVADLIESVVEISRLKMSPEFCLMHLEDRLQEIYFKSLMFSEYLRGAKTYNQRELTTMLGFETSDMPLLQAIAGTHSPGLLLGVQ